MNYKSVLERRLPQKVYNCRSKHCLPIGYVSSRKHMSPEKESGPAALDDDDLLFSLLDDVLSGSDLGQVSTPYPAEADQMINTAEIASEHEEQGGGTGGRLRHPSPMPTPLAPRPLLTRTSSRPWDRSSNDTPPDDIRMKEGINARTEPAKKRRLKPRQQAASPVLQESVGKDDDEDRSQVEVNKSMESTNITKSFFTGADEDITSPSSPTREQQLQYDSSGGNVGVSHGAPGASSGTISRPPGADQGSRGSRTDPNGVPGSAAPTPRLSDPLMVAARAAITAESLGAASRYDEDDPDRNRRDEGEGGLSAAGHARRPLDGRSSGAASPWRRSAGRVFGLLEPDALVVQRRVGADLLPSSPPPPRALSPPPLAEAQSQRRSAPASESSSSGRGNAILRPQRHPSSNQSREDGRRGAFPDRSASISKRGPQAGVARQSAPAGVPPVGVDAPSTRVPRRLRAAAAAASAGPSLRQQLAEELARSEEVSRRQRQPSQQQRGASGMITSEPGPGRSSSAIEDLDLDPHPAGSDDTALDRPTLASSREAGSRDHSEINADNWRHIVADLFPSVYDPVWHSSLFEFLSDLWPAVGKAHAGQGSRLRGGGMLSARTRVEQQELMRRAYEFAGLCWRAQDTRFRAGATVSFVENVCDHDNMFDECARMLPKDMLAYGVVPVLRAVHQDYHDIFLSLARDRLGIDWTPPPSSSRGGEAAEGGGGGLHWDGLLSRLRERRDLCHPEVDVTVLAYLDMGCNVE